MIRAAQGGSGYDLGYFIIVQSLSEKSAQNIVSTLVVSQKLGPPVGYCIRQDYKISMALPSGQVKVYMWHKRCVWPLLSQGMVARELAMKLTYWGQRLNLEIQPA